jgi:hypothetical protein
MTNEKRNTAIMDKVKRYTQHHTATPNLAQEAIERITMTNDKDSAMPSMKIQSSETFKESFTLNGEEIVLAVDDGVTMRVGSVSPHFANQKR